MECGICSRRNSVSALSIPPDAEMARLIGLVVFSGFAFPEVATVLEFFRSANALARLEHVCDRPTRYDVSLLSVAGGRISSSSSVFVWTESVENRRDVDGFHALFVASGAGARHEECDGRLIHWLRSGGERLAGSVGGLLRDAFTLVERDFGREFARKAAAHIMPRRPHLLHVDDSRETLRPGVRTGAG
jgi:transcriptional regulator GlxA family with amidase domain